MLRSNMLIIYIYSYWQCHKYEQDKNNYFSTNSYLLRDLDLQQKNKLFIKLIIR